MSQLAKLKKSSSLKDIAELLGYTPQSLSYILYKIDDSKLYTSFTIPKKSGGDRTILKPCDKLKLLQKCLSNLLYECLDEIKPKGEKLKDFQGDDNTKGKKKRAVKSISHGYEKGLSISTNAEMHINKRYVYNIDIKSFFPSFNFGRVRGYFLKNKKFKLHPKVSTIIAQIACFDNQLPQGSPCSPVISNLIAKNLDFQLLALAKNNSCTYTRYVDDLTFSTNLKDFPKKIAYRKLWSLRKNEWLLSNAITEIVTRSGFTVNAKKCRMQLNNSHQEVTGLTVNKKVNVPAHYYRNVRAMCNHFFREGSYYIPSDKVKVQKVKLTFIGRFTTWFSKSPPTQTPVISDKKLVNSIEILQGKLAYIYNVKSYRNRFSRVGYRPSRHDGIRRKENDNNPFPPLDRCDTYTDENHILALDGIRNLYGRFLFFKYFYFLQKPLIICEGKTDSVYLKCAIERLASSYPSLHKDNDGIPKLSFFNRTPTNTEMLKLAEGTPGLNYLIDTYKRLFKSYSCQGKLFPVIFIVDNDDAGRGTIRKADGIKKNNRKAKKITKIRHPNYYFENLYIVPVPNLGRKDSDIEDLFEDEVINTKLDKKSFYRQNKGLDTSKHYGKAHFSEYVVKVKKDRINFDKFKGLLNTIEDIIASHNPYDLD
ncbi:MAG: retron Ec67 family RNA-directed DNA polymerase/endonuclease [Colwellia sp.]|nr:retron Ec67 family RNA-directed DNA polymerase/endonuclease [Colwellia sp.]